MIHQVIEFNREVLGIKPRPLGFMPDIEKDHIVQAMREEVDEFIEAHEGGDLIGSIDAVCDLIYFAMGGLYKMGVTGDAAIEIFTAIHHANMEKKRGVVARRDTGAPDAIKPEGWMSPEERISAILDKHVSA